MDEAKFLSILLIGGVISFVSFLCYLWKYFVTGITKESNIIYDGWPQKTIHNVKFNTLDIICRRKFSLYDIKKIVDDIGVDKYKQIRFKGKQENSPTCVIVESGIVKLVGQSVIYNVEDITENDIPTGYKFNKNQTVVVCATQDQVVICSVTKEKNYACRKAGSEEYFDEFAEYELQDFDKYYQDKKK